MWIALARYQESGRFQSGDHLVRHLVRVAAGERSEVVLEDGALVQRGDEREIILVAELLVLCAATGRDVDQAGTLGFAYFVPRDDAVRFGGRTAAAGFAVRKNAAGFGLRGEFVEWSGVSETQEVAAGQFLQHLDTTAAF